MHHLWCNSGAKRGPGRRFSRHPNNVRGSQFTLLAKFPNQVIPPVPFIPSICEGSAVEGSHRPELVEGHGPEPVEGRFGEGPVVRKMRASRRDLQRASGANPSLRNPRNCCFQNLKIVLGKKSDVIDAQGFNLRLTKKAYLVSFPLF
jgi:hypothetical protein